MAQLTNKCTDDDIEYYIKECGDILGVSGQINNPDDPKAILNYIFQEIVKYKSSSLSWSADSEQHVRSNHGFGVARKENGQRSDVNSGIGSARRANSALGKSDM